MGHIDLHVEVLDEDFVRGTAPAVGLEMVLDRRSAVDLLALMALARLDADAAETAFVVLTDDRGVLTRTDPLHLDVDDWGWDVLDVDEREVWLVKWDEESRARHRPESEEITQIRIGVEGGRSLMAIPSLETWFVGTSQQVVETVVSVRRELRTRGAFLGEPFGPLLLSRERLAAVVGQADLVSYVRGEFQFDECAAHRLAGALVTSLLLRHPQLRPTLAHHDLAV
ncbi:hypothetical protein ASD11_09575 [Aeromicrobium sp. Root495]|uniref:hypothetical protein n=1 Tax=Aeromicrobium sp. Root495 TaxID=1736550 RepID=UPI0006F8512E|nr:hypothetical protein [Aeromicrobium sp. Root495]KQY59777.1 hypothetical protein ASD11_09575 [Aeromicrobium sp. Root495]RYJ05662.1 MAG: hypothetical protein EON52_10410 [Actinomycetales bacterium]